MPRSYEEMGPKELKLARYRFYLLYGSLGSAFVFILRFLGCGQWCGKVSKESNLVRQQ